MPRRPTAITALVVAAGLAVAAGGAFTIARTAKNRAAVEQVAETFASVEFAALPTDSLARLGETAAWDAEDLRTFSFVSAVLASDELPASTETVRAKVRTSLLAGEYAAALAAARSVQTEYDTLRRSETQGTR